MKAIISVSNKEGVADFAKGLASLGFEIHSTGGTKKALVEAGVTVKSVSDITNSPEILDGRVKTLHPKVHGGILARRDSEAHMEELKKHDIGLIDLVAVNLYPFVETVAKEGVTIDTALENIDIGGPTMIRASAKNFPGVITVVDPADYGSILEALKEGELSFEQRKKLAQKAFQHVALYDTAISQYLREGEEGFPQDMTVALKKQYDLRYGENPHQKAAFYAEQKVGADSADTGITWAEQLWGKQLSYNNILDADSAWGAAVDFPDPTVVIVKHTNPCGLASHDNVTEAYKRAFSGDTVSAFGGIVACNRKITAEMAEEMRPTFYEIVIAPEYEEEALEIFKKKKNLRVLLTKLPTAEQVNGGYVDYRRVRGGLLVQGSDSIEETADRWDIATKRKPTDQELKDLKFAWRVCKHVKSNAIAFIKDNMIKGIGAGQPNRAVSVHLAARKAGEESKGCVMASDAMFPFADSVEQAAEAGVTAIIQPGGSIRDQESIDAADKYGIAMIFTGVRHFKH